MEIKPEAQIEIMLWDWLKTKSKYLKEVYFNNSKNALGWKYFTVKGDQHKPDLVVSFDKGFGLEYIAIEVKDNKKNAQVYDATKIINLYYENQMNNLTTYFIEDNPIKIKYFLIATQGSKEGKILNTNDIIISNRFDFGGHRENLVNFGNEPEYEWSDTSQFTRNLFNSFKQYRNKHKLTKLGGEAIGILTTNIEPKEEMKSLTEGELLDAKKIIDDFEKETGKKLNFTEEQLKKEKIINNKKCILSENPYMFIMNYNNYNPNYKAKWGCRFWEL